MSAARGALELRERTRAVEAAWLATLLLSLLAVGGPWYLRSLDVELGPALWSAFVFAALVWLAGPLQDRLRGRRALLLASALGQAAGVLSLSWLWHLVGGVENPVFLLAFFVPVAAASVLLPRGLAAGTTALAALAAGAVAVAESSELRWYLIQLGAPIEGLSLLPRAAPPAPFPGAATGPAFQLTALALFAVLLAATFVVCERLAGQRARLARREAVAAHALEGEAQALFQAALQASPWPTVLVYADSGQLVEASRSFVNQMLLRPREVAGRPLAELLEFEDRGALRGLLAAPRGELALCAYRVGAEARVARVRSHRVAFAGESFACLSFEEREPLFLLARALDGVQDAVLLVRDGREIAYHNRAAAALYPGLHAGGDAAELLGTEGGPAWWADPGARRDPAGRPLERVAARGEAGESFVLTRIRGEGGP